MQLSKDRSYFRDIDQDGKLKKHIGSEQSPAGIVFGQMVQAKSRESVSIQVHATASNEWDGQKKLSKQAQEKIHELKQSIWKLCVSAVMRGNRDYIGSFPQRSYRLYVLEDREGKTYPVDLDCQQLIEEHTAAGFEKLWEEKEKLIQPERQRKKLRIAAVLVFIHLLLNLAMTLSCLPEYAFLYPAKLNPTLWGLMVAGIMLAALIYEGGKSLQPLFGLILVLFTFAIQSAGPTMQGLAGEILHQYADNLEESKAMMVFGILLLIPSLVYWILYTIRACKAKVDPATWQPWISRFDAQAENIHRELCFLMLWYKHMTGKTCGALEAQEKELFRCAACAQKYRKK